MDNVVPMRDEQIPKAILNWKVENKEEEVNLENVRWMG